MSSVLIQTPSHAVSIGSMSLQTVSFQVIYLYYLYQVMYGRTRFLLWPESRKVHISRFWSLPCVAHYQTNVVASFPTHPVLSFPLKFHFPLYHPTWYSANKRASMPHGWNVCLRRYSIHTFVHSWWRPLASTSSNYNSTIIRRRLLKVTLTFDLWPYKTFQQFPLIWWIFVSSFIEIPPLSTEISRHAK